MHVGILGGGIAGLSAGIALAQAGHRVSVFERDVRPRGIGAGVVCWPNAVFVLEALGVIPRLERVTGRVRAMTRFTATGEVLGRLDVERLERLCGRPSLSVLRRDLHDALLGRAAEVGVEIAFGQPLTALEETPCGARARFADERSFEADLLLGAEGRMRSVARDFVVGDGTPIDQGFVNWVGVFEGDRPLFQDMAVRDYWGLGERFGIVPISPTAAYWAGGEAREAQPKQRAGLKARLIEQFGRWADPIVEVVRGTEDARINEIQVRDHDPCETWHRANVLLIGDAAHAALPTSGQGACQALEDAWHLARVLDSSGSIEDACQTFTELRRAKTTAITQGGRRLAASLFATDPSACERRDAEARVVDYGAMVEGMSRFWTSGLPLEELRSR
ncbi:MAG: FAD-dependent monooxygenase [Planctomycetes bacterium]|nr:FAD-dependent monooxygenase [Planctomycetota bacterium]